MLRENFDHGLPESIWNAAKEQAPPRDDRRGAAQKCDQLLGAGRKDCEL